MQTKTNKVCMDMFRRFVEISPKTYYTRFSSFDSHFSVVKPIVREHTCLQFYLMANVSSLRVVIWFVRIRFFLFFWFSGASWWWCRAAICRTPCTKTTSTVTTANIISTAKEYHGSVYLSKKHTTLLTFVIFDFCTIICFLLCVCVYVFVHKRQQKRKNSNQVWLSTWQFPHIHMYCGTLYS